MNCAIQKVKLKGISLCFDKVFASEDRFYVGMSFKKLFTLRQQVAAAFILNRSDYKHDREWRSEKWISSACSTGIFSSVQASCFYLLLQLLKSCLIT